VAGLAQAFGSGAMTNSIADFAKADLLFVIGSNTTECHPMIGRVIRQGVKFRGTKLMVADARAIDLAKIADLHLRHKPGTDVALLNAMMHVIIAENLHDHDFIRERTEGFEQFAETVGSYPPERAETITGVSRSDIVKAARLFAGAERASVLYGMGITQHTTGTDNVKSLANLIMLTGNVGREGTGLSPLRGQNNVQGACDVGALPNVLPGYQAVSDPAKREPVRAEWGVGTLPEKPGLTMGEMIQGALEGRVKAMYIMGENPIMSDPDMLHTSKSLMNLQFLVVQDIFPTETVVMADVVFPAAAFAEKEGTFTNTERRVQRVRKAVEPPGEAKPDWEIITLLALKMGGRFLYKGPEAIMKEIASVTPIYGGIHYGRLEKYGLQWPCPDRNHPGTARLHQGTFIRGLGKFHGVEYRPPAESVSPAYPLILTTGRVLEHYHAGSMSRRSEVLNELCPSGAVEIHPEDASKLCVVEGDMIALASVRGKIEAPVHVTDRTAPGLAFMAFHWKESPVNVVTNPALDPSAKIPEFKVAAINAVLAVLDRAAQDNAFFARLAQNPAEALKEYELTPEERAAIVSGDIRKIESWVGKLEERLRTWLIARLQQEKW
jgi:formate dehydrogenase alpha subunit